MLPIFVQELFGASRCVRFFGRAGGNAAQFSCKKFRVGFAWGRNAAHFCPLFSRSGSTLDFVVKKRAKCCPSFQVEFGSRDFVLKRGRNAAHFCPGIFGAIRCMRFFW